MKASKSTVKYTQPCSKTTFKWAVRTSVRLWCLNYSASTLSHTPSTAMSIKNTSRRDDTEKTVGGAGSGFWELTNQSSLGFVGGGTVSMGAIVKECQRKFNLLFQYSSSFYFTVISCLPASPSQVSVPSSHWKWCDSQWNAWSRARKQSGLNTTMPGPSLALAPPLSSSSSPALPSWSYPCPRCQGILGRLAWTPSQIKWSEKLDRLMNTGWELTASFVLSTDVRFISRTRAGQKRLRSRRMKHIWVWLDHIHGKLN